MWGRLKERFIDSLIGFGTAFAIGVVFLAVAGVANTGNPLAYASLGALQLLLIYSGFFLALGLLNFFSYSGGGYWAHPITGIFEGTPISEDGWICDWVED